MKKFQNDFLKYLNLYQCVSLSLPHSPQQETAPQTTDICWLTCHFCVEIQPRLETLYFHENGMNSFIFPRCCLSIRKELLSEQKILCPFTLFKPFWAKKSSCVPKLPHMHTLLLPNVR